MKAKDTVMSKGQISDAKKGHTAVIQAHPSVYEDDIAIAEAQAEITWQKAQAKVLLTARDTTKLPKEVPKGYPKCCEESYMIGYKIGYEDGYNAP